MTARDKFKKGDAVRASEYGLSKGIFRWDGLGHTGVVVGFGRDDPIVRVKTDNTNYPLNYHMDFWTKVQGQGLEGKG